MQGCGCMRRCLAPADRLLPSDGRGWPTPDAAGGNISRVPQAQPKHALASLQQPIKGFLQAQVLPPPPCQQSLSSFIQAKQKDQRSNMSGRLGGWEPVLAARADGSGRRRPVTAGSCRRVWHAGAVWLGVFCVLQCFPALLEILQSGAIGLERIVASGNGAAARRSPPRSTHKPPRIHEPALARQNVDACAS